MTVQRPRIGLERSSIQARPCRRRCRPRTTAPTSSSIARQEPTGLPRTSDSPEPEREERRAPPCLRRFWRCGIGVQELADRPASNPSVMQRSRLATAGAMPRAMRHLNYPGRWDTTDDLDHRGSLEVSESGSRGIVHRDLRSLVMIYSRDASADRAFFRDVLGTTS